MIDITVRRASSSIDAWLRALAAPAPAVSAAAEVVEEAVRDSIRARRDPRGRPWRPLTPTTIELRRRGLGGSTGSMLSGVGSRLDRGERRAVVYVDAPGMREVVQQRGIRAGRLKVFGRASRKSVPAREFMPQASALPPRLRAAIKGAFLTALREALR